MRSHDAPVALWQIRVKLAPPAQNPKPKTRHERVGDVASVYNRKHARSDILPRVPWLVISPRQGL